MSYCVTILTATYNRGKLLSKLYESLCQQTAKDFQWLIIDDGSTDNTESIVKRFQTDGFCIEYHRKNNGGKHTALNYSHPFIKGKLVFMVDSDDFLGKDAVESIKEDWEKYKNRKDIGIISFLKGGIDGSGSMSPSYAPDYYISDHITYRVNHNIGGDMAEVVRADIFEKYIFPSFIGEKFISEAWLWNSLALKYKTVYRQKIIYYCAYLDDGLTKSGRAMFMRNPLGMMENYKTFFYPQFSMRAQLKGMLLYLLYGFCSKMKMSEILRKSKRAGRLIPIIPFAWGLYQLWSKKYK